MPTPNLNGLVGKKKSTQLESNKTFFKHLVFFLLQKGVHHWENSFPVAAAVVVVIAAVAVVVIAAVAVVVAAAVVVVAGAVVVVVAAGTRTNSVSRVQDFFPVINGAIKISRQNLSHKKFFGVAFGEKS